MLIISEKNKYIKSLNILKKDKFKYSIEKYLFRNTKFYLGDIYIYIYIVMVVVYIV